MAAQRGTIHDDCVLVNRDCRTYTWPDRLDAVCTDPPWADLSCYEWLGSWAVERVRPGGWVLVQCGTAHLPKVLTILSGAGLSYVWCLAFGYSQSSQAKATTKFRATWRPVLLFSVGAVELPDESVSDWYTVKAEPKKHFAWEQPPEPFRYWLGRLVRPGGLVADPFAGSGTTAVVCRELGLRFVGTEKDKDNYKVARGRLKQ